MLLREMKLPVVIEVAARAKRTQSQDSLCARNRPKRTRTTHAILDEISTGALDDASRDRQALGERAIVVKQVGVPDEVLGGALNWFRGLGIQRVAFDHLPQALSDVPTTVTVEQRKE